MAGEILLRRNNIPGLVLGPQNKKGRMVVRRPGVQKFGSKRRTATRVDGERKFIEDDAPFKEGRNCYSSFFYGEHKSSRSMGLHKLIFSSLIAVRILYYCLKGLEVVFS